MTARRPPGPRGPAANAENTQAFHRDIFGFLSRIAAEYGDVAAFELGDRTCVLVNRADLVRLLFSRHEADLRKPDFLTVSNRGHWGDGLTTLNMAEWRLRRPLLRPSFRNNAVAPRLTLTRECTLNMIANWQPGALLSLTFEFRSLAARLALRSILDADIEGFGDTEERAGAIPLSEALGEDYSAPGGGYGDARFEMVRPRAGPDMSHTLRIIDARLAGGDARDDILSAWLAEIARSEDTLEGDAVRGEIIQMLFASHLTLPLSLIAVCHALARNRDIAAQIAAEAEGMDWTRTDLQYVLSGTMAMLAVKEALRLAPPAPILYREAGDTFNLEGFTIEAGQAVWVAPQLLHHDPRYFTRPDIFDPLRFRRDRSTPHSISAYMPFGTGPRTCIASRQSFLQMAMIALLVAEHVQLVPAANSEDQFKVLRHTP